MKYICLFSIAVILLTLNAVFIYPLFTSLVNAVVGVTMTAGVAIIILTLWNMAVTWYDLDGRAATFVDVEKEKLFTINEYRRLHDIDYAEFSDTIRQMYDDNRRKR